jgi:hypothetical protein
MVSGYKYELLWPGGEIHWWGWGRIEENEKKGRSCDIIPCAILSGTPRVSFTVVEEPPAAVYETPGPQWPSAPAYVISTLQRSWLIRSFFSLGTPLLDVTLTGAKRKEPADDHFELVQTVTYRGLVFSNDPDTEPEPATQSITFDALNIMIPLEWVFRSQENGEWQYCPDQSVSCAMTDLIYDTEMAVNIGKDRRWISLAPGESWSQELEINERLPVDLAPGDKTRYHLEGRVIEMWNWGSKEDHAEIVLMLPSGYNVGDWINRSPIVVPALNTLEFTIV